MADTLARQVRQRSPGTKVFVSFQADEANGANGRIDPIVDHCALMTTSTSMRWGYPRRTPGERVEFFRRYEQPLDGVVAAAACGQTQRTPMENP